MRKLLQVIMFVVICELVGFLGSFFTFSSIPNWYVYLNKPFFSPPNWVFGPVWTILYALMGVSAFLVWKKRKSLNLFWIQLALNFIWTPVFFGAKQLFLALIIIVAMWIYILKTIKYFSKIDKTAGYLLWPYLAWVSFAGILNFSIWILNR